MAYAKQRVMLDADSHIMETPDWVSRHADPKIREQLAPLALGKAGGATYQAIEKAVERTAKRKAEGAAIADVVKGAKGWSAPGAFDADERVKALDDLGFGSQLVFSTFSAGQYLAHKDMEVRYGGLRAHNRAMAEFCAVDRRLVAVGQLSLSDPARAVKEIEEGVKMGCGAFWIPGTPVDDHSPGHPDVDPVWAALIDHNAPFMLHVGPNSNFVPKAYLNNGKPIPKDIVGGGENLRVRDFVSLSFGPQLFITSLVFDQVFERFPKLRGGVIELGAGWVPEFLRNLDISQKIFKRSDPSVAELPLKASDYVRRALRFTPFPGEDVGRMIKDGGADLFLFSSDYPHPEGTDDPIGRFERTFTGIGEDEKEQFYSGNYKYMMGAV
ncbi:MAG TPA: amidohydrolase family protein [Caulobacterales bacterium]|jgi:predicted TIM-barrel fold metal-dependent hydrolase|nr:amidohydrolase family protein [Caulobacterales bacterium]